MPVTFSQIANGTATVAVPTHAGVVNVSYFPNKITTKMIADVKDDDTLMTDIIASWDVMTDEDQSVMFPLTRISEFGLPFKVQVIEAIVEDIRPKQTVTQS